MLERGWATKHAVCGEIYWNYNVRGYYGVGKRNGKLGMGAGDLVDNNMGGGARQRGKGERAKQKPEGRSRFK